MHSLMAASLPPLSDVLLTDFWIASSLLISISLFPRTESRISRSEDIMLSCKIELRCFSSSSVVFVLLRSSERVLLATSETLSFSKQSSNASIVARRFLRMLSIANWYSSMTDRFWRLLSTILAFKTSWISWLRVRVSAFSLS
ncbi:hypothetical protein BS50DRAFT_32846 [Corynespora cassiicola Philippines]|uniref:Uncharacterized protein n=1 Tax=Corynespora cassiicola Philippines TaxID=1448308 RepID=A0A2T2PBT3_CORCC|nr:hypothetical protein BS50DRAFT_32846 [Corynespora cassiicola Philippines]